MWNKLKLIILTATPTAILLALWFFNRKSKRKLQDSHEPYCDSKTQQSLPTIEVTEVNDVDLKSQIEISYVDSELQDANLDSVTETNTYIEPLTELKDSSLKCASESNSAGLTSRILVSNGSRKSHIEDADVESNLQKEVGAIDLKSSTELKSETLTNSAVCKLMIAVTESSEQSLSNIPDGDVNSLACNDASFAVGLQRATHNCLDSNLGHAEEARQADLFAGLESSPGIKSEKHCSEKEDSVNDVCGDDVHVCSGASEQISDYDKSESPLEKQLLENGLESSESVDSHHDSHQNDSHANADESLFHADQPRDEAGSTEAQDVQKSDLVLDTQKEDIIDLGAEKDHVVYQFDFPSDLCGRLIGKHGHNISSIKEKSGADIAIKHKVYSVECQVVVLEGTKRQVSSGLRLIKARFPESRFPNISYEQSAPEVLAPVSQNILQLMLPSGVNSDVIVSRVVSANHVFLQQPTHPSFPHLERQMQMMMQCYDSDVQTPGLPRPYEVGIVCVARIDGFWYRVQIVGASTGTDDCDVKLVDYGGYVQVQGSELKQIRRDFTTLPFQAIECYLYGVISPSDEEDFPPEALSVLVELVSGAILQANVVAIEEDQVPYIHLSKPVGSQNMNINRELVNRGVARWFEL